MAARADRRVEFGQPKIRLVCIGVKTIILRWSLDALRARHTFANEGAIYGCCRIIWTPRPTKSLRRSWQRDAYLETERLRSDPVHYDFFVGLGDLYGNAADLLRWPP